MEVVVEVIRTKADWPIGIRNLFSSLKKKNLSEQERSFNENHLSCKSLQISFFVGGRPGLAVASTRSRIRAAGKKDTNNVLSLKQLEQHCADIWLVC